MRTAPSTRAQVITRRTYNRPVNDNGTQFETWEQTVGRVMDHQRWLWERASGQPLNMFERQELLDLAEIIKKREALPSGRQLWLGGTEVSKSKESTMFNCSAKRVESVFDVVDLFHLLLQGCGVGFTPTPGTLHGFSKKIKIENVYSERDKDYKGNPNNIETFDEQSKTWRIVVGDSGEAWSKAIGKIVAHVHPKAETLIIDTTQVRGPGGRVKGYGWISQGDKALQAALTGVCGIFNKRVGQLLTAIDILDVMNFLGTVLSTRRSAEIALLPYGHPEWRDFALAKKDHWEGNMQRSQSNNSLVFEAKPTRKQLEEIFELMQEAGGSEPGFINAQAARKRAPWFSAVNPCAEILLSGSGSFCNLVEVNVSAFNGRMKDLFKTIRLIARANYRQSTVDLRDGILGQTWHENNNFLRLCGVGLTGIAAWEHKDNPETFKQLRIAAHEGANDMADELDLPRSKAITTIKPSGTLSKIMDCPEGIHVPLGKYIFNNINFPKHDPLVGKLIAANYKVIENPYDKDSVTICFPVAWENVEFTDIQGLEINNELAVTQLERYKMVMQNYVDHNCSITVSYDADEVSSIIDWILENWDDYVGVSFLYNTDPTKSAEDLGYLYLPQEVVSKEKYEEYVAQLKPINMSSSGIIIDDLEDDCEGGACPIR